MAVENGSPSKHAPASTAPPRRRLRASERRTLILGAAVDLFASRGYHAASMEEIAAAAGISKAVVYDHFVSKHALYTVLLEKTRADVDAAVEAAVAPLGDDGEARVRAAMEAFFRFVEENPQACRLLFLEIQSAAEVAEIVRAIDERVTLGVATQLGGNAAIFDGHPARERQLRILAELIKSAVHGLASWWYRHPDVPRADLVDRSVGIVWPAIERAGAGAGPTTSMG
jgi:AcrR family transcriptional regulator